MFGAIRNWWLRSQQKRRDALWPERRIVVTLDETGITVRHPDRVEQIAWDEMERVEVHTNDSGPWGPDVWFVIESPSGQCTYPQGATGEQEALDRLFELPGFKSEALINAMGSSENAVFVCWERSGAAPDKR